MGNQIDYLFPKKDSDDSGERVDANCIMDFIKSHTYELPGNFKLVMVSIDEIEDMMKTAEEKLLPSTETPAEKPPIAIETPQQPANPKAESVASGDIIAKLDEVKELLERDNHKDSIIKDLHHEMERLNGNFFEDIRRPMIKSIIAIHRQLTGRVRSLEKNPAGADVNSEDLYNEFTKNLKFDMTAVGDILEDEYDLEYFEPAIGDLYNPKENNAIRVISTDDEQQDNIIQEVLYGGFKNTNTDRIFLKANVIVNKHKKL